MMGGGRRIDGAEVIDNRVMSARLHVRFRVNRMRSTWDQSLDWRVD